MIHIKRKVKNKIFHDMRCQKLCKTRRIHCKKVTHTYYKQGSSKKFRLLAPKELSIFDSTDTSLMFFEDVLSKIMQCGLNSTLYFDLSQVEVITPDAIMYLIAIINNNKRIRMNRIICEGNMPNNPGARSVFRQTGFYKFVSSKYKYTINESTAYMKIQNGKKADSVLAGNFCDFVHNNCQQTYIGTKRLYTMIVELMTNTYQHAYHNSKKTRDCCCDMYSNWYIFAQDMGNSVRFIFLDTGVGIPKTVYKRFTESISNLVGIKTDSFYLKSALTGDYGRSETRLSHRGKGLPGIYEDCKNAFINNLKIISGKAKCIMNNDGSITAIDIDSPFQGTLFAWEIVK